jgi:Uma2 family endonuclease
MTAAEKIQEEDQNDLVEPRFERIGSTVYAMSSPGYRHQIIAGRLFAQLDAQLSGHDCSPVIAPFDIYPLYDLGDEYTLVQPDISVVCDKSKLKENRYNGAPRFIIEILSSNRSHDMVTKLNLYQKAGVEEYWIVDPGAEGEDSEKFVSVLELSGGFYIHHAYGGEKEIPLITIPGCSVDFSKV